MCLPLSRLCSICCDVDVVTVVWTFFNHLDKATGWESLDPQYQEAALISIGLRVLTESDINFNLI